MIDTIVFGGLIALAAIFISVVVTLAVGAMNSKDDNLFDE